MRILLAMEKLSLRPPLACQSTFKSLTATARSPGDLSGLKHSSFQLLTPGQLRKSSSVVMCQLPATAMGPPVHTRSKPILTPVVISPLILSSGFTQLRRLHCPVFPRSHVSPPVACRFARAAARSSTSTPRRPLKGQVTVLLAAGEERHVTRYKRLTENFRKETTKMMVNLLSWQNLLGLDENLKNGGLKEGNLNFETLQFKRRFPHEIILTRVGEFYEAVGFDACLLVEYANLNPMGNIRQGSMVPRAGAPVQNLRQTLHDLTASGFSVCVVEEAQDAGRSSKRKERFVGGHAHPGSPYVYGLAADSVDFDFPEQRPCVALGRDSRGYFMFQVLETMRTFLHERGLTEEAVVAKLRAASCHQLYCHVSLKENSTDTVRWSRHGEGGLLFTQIESHCPTWYGGDPLLQLLHNVREHYDLDADVTFREMTTPGGDRMRPLYVPTATQIGILASPAVPSLLGVLMPAGTHHLCISYFRNVLLNPPPFQVATSVQEACRLMATLKCPVPEFTPVAASKMVKLITAREANDVEMGRIRQLARSVLALDATPELRPLTGLLLPPSQLVTGLSTDPATLLADCRWIDEEISIILAPDAGDCHVAPCQSPVAALENLFADHEGWRGKIDRQHAELAYTKVEAAAEKLSEIVDAAFQPIVVHVQCQVAGISAAMRAKAEILYRADAGSVWLKAKNFKSAVGGSPAYDEAARALRAATDERGKRVGDEWFTTDEIESALATYKEAAEAAREAVVEELRQLAVRLERRMSAIVTMTSISVIAHALLAHVREASRRSWVLPVLVEFKSSPALPPSSEPQPLSRRHLAIEGLVPYWLDPVSAPAVRNSVDMSSLFLLTGPNGGGKSSLLRSLCAAALLANCGLYIPARSARVPRFDAIMLRMMASDSPADAKSSFQMEMQDVKVLIKEASAASLVLVDELCRGTEVQKGTYLAGGVVEELDRVGCLGIISTHLHGLLDLPLDVKNVALKMMGLRKSGGSLEATWQLQDGACRESLAYQVALAEGVPPHVIHRARQLESRGQAGNSHLSQSTLYASSVSHVLPSGIEHTPSPAEDADFSKVGRQPEGSKADDVSSEENEWERDSWLSASESTSSYWARHRVKTETAQHSVPTPDDRWHTPTENEQARATGGTEVLDADQLSAMSASLPPTAAAALNGKPHGQAAANGHARRHQLADGPTVAEELLDKPGPHLPGREPLVLRPVPEAALNQVAAGVRTLEAAAPLVLGICGEILTRNSVARGAFDHQFVIVPPGEIPPPSSQGQSCVYILQRPDGQFYIGETDDISTRVRSHRAQFRKRPVPVGYIFLGGGKSTARLVETALITRLQQLGLPLVNKADQQHRHFGVQKAPF